MIEILFRVEVQPSKRQEFVDFIDDDARVARDPEREPGTLWFEYHEDSKNPDAFFVHEAYRDCEAFAVHQSHAPYKHWKSRIVPNVLASFQPLYENGLTAHSAARLSSDDLAALEDLNRRVAVMEQQRDEGAKEWFEDLLSDRLVFRRASGVVVGKPEFIKALSDPNPFVSRQTEGIIAAGVADDRALVILVVRTQKADNSENRYRNIRLLSNENRSWVLERWYNYEITGS